VSVVEQVVVLRREESVRVDPDRLGALYMQLGEHGAEDVVCRAVEELAVRLTDCERLWRASDLAGLSKSARTVAAISEQVGMTALARVAGDVSATAGTFDAVAQAATLGRMMRVGERSLTAVWDLQHLSI
jgi:hypothetical protein